MATTSAGGGACCNSYSGDVDREGRPHGRGVLHICDADDAAFSDDEAGGDGSDAPRRAARVDTGDGDGDGDGGGKGGSSDDAGDGGDDNGVGGGGGGGGGGGCAAGGVNNTEDDCDANDSDLAGSDAVCTGVCAACGRPYAVFDGGFRHGVQHGGGRLTFPDGAVQEGTWRDGRPCGLAVFHEPPGNEGEGEGEVEGQGEKEVAGADEAGEEEQKQQTAGSGPPAAVADGAGGGGTIVGAEARLQTYDENGDITGPGLELNELGDVSFIGHYRDGVRNGLGSTFFWSCNEALRWQYRPTAAPATAAAAATVGTGASTSTSCASAGGDHAPAPAAAVDLPGLRAVLQDYLARKGVGGHTWPTTFVRPRRPHGGPAPLAWSHEPDGELQVEWDDGAVRAGSRATFFFPDGTRIEGRWRGDGMSAGVFHAAPPVPIQGDGVVAAAASAAAATPAAAAAAAAAAAGTPTAVSRLFCLDESTATCISSEPLLPDPYESATVFVAPSKVLPDGAAGEGLFAKVRIPAGRIASWYSGVRVPCAEVDGRPDWSLNDNVINLDADVAIDVPPQWSSTEAYCASLGHKANHVGGGRHNAEYDMCTHPRFGEIKCVRAVRDVAPGEEVTVDYGFFDEFPPWWVGEAAEKQHQRQYQHQHQDQDLQREQTTSASQEAAVSGTVAKRKAGEQTGGDVPRNKAAR